LLAGLIPVLIAGTWINWRLKRESQQREALIHEQINFVESRHEELREAYLEQEQTRVELRRTVNHLTALHQAGLIFSSTLDREALLEKVLETLMQDLHYDRAMISFYDPVARVTRDARVVGVSPEIQTFAGKGVADRRRPSRLGTDASRESTARPVDRDQVVDRGAAENQGSYSRELDGRPYAGA
jgi:hypothetical protein